MDDKFKLYLTVGVIRALCAQYLITDEQKNLAINSLFLIKDWYKNADKRVTTRQPHKEGSKGDKSSRIL